MKFLSHAERLAQWPETRKQGKLQFIGKFVLLMVVVNCGINVLLSLWWGDELRPIKLLVYLIGGMLMGALLGWSNWNWGETHCKSLPPADAD